MSYLIRSPTHSRHLFFHSFHPLIMNPPIIKSIRFFSLLFLLPCCDWSVWIIVKTAQIRNGPVQNGPTFLVKTAQLFFLSEMGLICEFEVFIFQTPFNPPPPPNCLSRAVSATIYKMPTIFYTPCPKKITIYFDNYFFQDTLGIWI